MKNYKYHVLEGDYEQGLFPVAGFTDLEDAIDFFKIRVSSWIGKDESWDVSIVEQQKSGELNIIETISVIK